MEDLGNIYHQNACLYIGELFPGLRQHNAIEDIEIQVVNSSSELSLAMSQPVKLLIFRVFDDQSKNLQVLNTVIALQQDIKILIIGAQEEQFKKHIRQSIVAYLPDNTDLETLKLNLEQIMFFDTYGEMVDGEVIKVNHLNRKLANVFWVGMALIFGSSILVTGYLLK
jgi:hypothetical protein